MTAQLIHEATRAETTEPATPAGRWRLPEACHPSCLTVQKMNYASRRVVEQAPAGVDEQRHSR